MPIDRTEYATDFQIPDLIQRGVATVLQCPVYRDDALVAPTSGTITILKPDGTELQAATAFTVTSSVATYSVAGATTTNEALSMGYRVIWEMLIGGKTYSFRNELGVVRYAPSMPSSDRDLIARHSALDRHLAGTGETSWQNWIDESWNQLQRWLIRMGNRPHLIVQSSELKDLHTVWALMIIFRDLETDADPDGRYSRLAERYKMELDDLMEQCHFQYATEDQQVPDARRRSGQPITVLGVSGFGDGYRWWER